MTLKFQPTDKPPPASADPGKDALFDFHRASDEAARNQRLRNALRTATLHYNDARQRRLQELPDANALRQSAQQIRQHTLEHLDYYLEQLVANITQQAGQVHFASDAAEAQRLILDIASRTHCRRIVKSRSAVTDEINLAAAMQQAGLELLETDLGQFIGQISHDRPSHPHAPLIHMDQASIAKALSAHLQIPPADPPQPMGTHLRAHLRDAFRQADMGVTGANFLIAQTGQVCLVSNDANIRHCTTPRVRVIVAGIEKLLPRLADLSVMLKLLSRSATGQTMAVYTSLFGALRTAPADEKPQEFHLVLLDNGRSRILASDYRETLRCIHCNACLNACPVYRTIGDQAYGHAYTGPIGAILAPLIDGLEHHKDLPYASTLCGACVDACPVQIDIPKHLVNLRREIVARHLDSRLARKACQLWMRLLNATLFNRVTNLFRAWRRRPDPQTPEWITRGDGLLANWTESRDLPKPASETFQQLWQQRPANPRRAPHE